MRLVNVCLVAVCLSACRFDATLGSQSRVACRTSAQCPAGLVCQVSASLCVKSEALDNTPPDITRSTVTVAPKAGNPLSAPSALGRLSEVTLSVVVSEALSEAPAALAMVEGEPEPRVSCQQLSADPPAYDFRCEVVDGVGGPNAGVAWQISLSDLALNPRTVTLESTTPLDVTAPPAPITADAGVEVRDSPWGDPQTALVPSTRVSAGPQAVAQAQRVALRRGTALLGSTSVNADGSFAPFEVLRSESNELIEVQSIDAAGNVSPWSAVHDFLWVATFNGKLADRNFPNPHRFEVQRVLTEGLEGFATTERGASDGIDFAGGKAVHVTGGGSWRKLEFSLAPEGRSGVPGAAYDPLRSRVVRFGGVEPNGAQGSTVWEWSGLDWKVRVPSDPEGDGNPGGRYLASLAWDQRLSGVVLYGGLGEIALNDTWLWNGVSWRRLPDGPAPRIAPVLFFDPTTNAMVMHGGVDTSGQTMLDAWQLDSAGWSPLATAPPLGARVGAAVCIEPITDTVFAFGGDDTSSQLQLRMNGQWVEAPGSSPGPSPRRFASCAWDVARNRLVLTGGDVADAGITDEVWEYTDSHWENHTPRTGPLPGPRAQHRLIYDPAREMMLMFGTQVGSTEVDTTWRWTGSAWEIAYRPTVAPDVVAASNLVWDPRRGAIRGIGFSLATGVENFWFARGGWQREVTTALPLGSSRLAFDPVLDRCMIATGNESSPMTSVWGSQSDGGWQLLTLDAGVAAVSLVDVAITPNGLDLVHLTPPSLALTSISRLTGAPFAQVDLGAGFYASAATSASGTGVLVSESLAGVAPKLRLVKDGVVTAGPELPEPIVPNGIVGDLARGTLIVPGGARINRLSDETWELSAAGWHRVPISDPDSDGQPLLPLLPAVGFDQGAEAVIAVELRGARPASAWLLALARQRPQVSLRFSTTLLPKDLEMREVALVLRAGGSGGSATEAPGVEVSLRSPGWWTTPVLVSTASASTPEEVRIPLTGADSRYVSTMITRIGEIDYAVRPVGTNRSGEATLVIDAAQLELRYRRP